jgi:hypothetical protein
MLLCLGTVGAASAAETPDTLQQQIDEVLAKTVGGVQISENEIAWENGSVIMAFPMPGEAEAPLSSPTAMRLMAKASAPAVMAPQAVDEAAQEAIDAADEDSNDGPDSGVTASGSDSSCPTQIIGNDWYCFYQYKNYGGRRLQFSEKYTMSNAPMFDAWDFENRTSSWSNKGGKTIYVAGRTVTGSNYSCHNYVDGKRPVLWQESDHSHSSSLGSLDNKADCFWTS